MRLQGWQLWTAANNQEANSMLRSESVECIDGIVHALEWDEPADHDGDETILDSQGLPSYWSTAFQPHAIVNAGDSVRAKTDSTSVELPRVP